MVSQYRLLTEDKTRGVYISEMDLIKIIQVCYNRNKGLFIKLVADYEYLEGKKFDYKLIGINKLK